MAGRQFPHRNQGSAAFDPAGAWVPERLIAAAATAAAAFFCYYATLLPGLDLGDSASFQTGVSSLTLTPRQAYPLYYGLGQLFVWLHPGEPARAMNLASAVYGSVAVGLATLLAARLAASTLAGLTAGLLLAFSYTFWSQAITAEVYTLHLMLLGGALLALTDWAERPTTARLALFYALCALGFGNHLSMLLALPAFTVFLLVRRHGGPSDPLRPRMVALAVGIAAAGALQYVWNFRGLWTALEPPLSLAEALGKSWFDITKADWRETLVMGLSESGLWNRPAMYWFDLRQQFGAAGALLAALGGVHMVLRRPSMALLLVLLYLANLAFAWTYNVGDPYIFFLPSHYVVALFAGAGAAAVVYVLGRVSSRAIAVSAGALCIIYPVWRGYDTFPAADRSRDTRALRLLAQMIGSRDASAGVSCSERIMGLDANWQLQNAVEYYTREFRPDLTWFTTDQLSWLPLKPASVEAFVLAGTREGRREILATEDTVHAFRASGAAPSAIAVEPSATLATRVAELAKGQPYALGVLTPDRAFRQNRSDVENAVRLLTGRADLSESPGFTVVIGRVGDPPTLIRAERRPFRTSARIGDLEFDVRMESWLPTDTIRRSGFGHIVVNRSHVLTLERGISLVVLGDAGTPLLTEYRGGLFEAPRRFRLGYGGVVPATCYR